MSDCLGERLAPRGAQRQADALVLFGAQSGRSVSESVPRMKLGRERMAAEGMSQPKMSQVLPLWTLLQPGEQKAPHMAL